MNDKRHSGPTRWKQNYFVRTAVTGILHLLSVSVASYFSLVFIRGRWPKFGNHILSRMDKKSLYPLSVSDSNWQPVCTSYFLLYVWSKSYNKWYWQATPCDSKMNRSRKVGQDSLKIGKLVCSVNRSHLDDTGKSKQGHLWNIMKIKWFYSIFPGCTVHLVGNVRE